MNTDTETVESPVRWPSYVAATLAIGATGAAFSGQWHWAYFILGLAILMVL